jgi:glycerol uptake facilitator-like aquaporin
VSGILFVASFVLHWWVQPRAANADAALHHLPASSLFAQLSNAELWFESFQNWQSEFLSTAVLVVLSIFLRHKGSPESKPVSPGGFFTKKRHEEDQAGAFS